MRGFVFLMSDDKRRTLSKICLLIGAIERIAYLPALANNYSFVFLLVKNLEKIITGVVCNGETVDDYLKEITDNLRGE